MPSNNEPKCPLLKDNPGCPFIETITQNNTDIKWLKKMVGVRLGLDVGTIISLIALILKLAGAY